MECIFKSLLFALFITFSDNFNATLKTPLPEDPDKRILKKPPMKYCSYGYECVDEYGYTVRNTLCERAPCKPTRICGPYFKQLLFSDAEKQQVLDHMNSYRQRIASGIEYRFSVSGSFYRSAIHTSLKTNALSWDVELALGAQCMANACLDQGWQLHDLCRRTFKFPKVGQNFYMYTHVNEIVDQGRYNFLCPKYLMNAIDTWYSEIYSFNYSVEALKKYVYDPLTSNFTQMVWGTSTAVGCGRSQYGANRVVRLLIYCNFGVAGNQVGEEIYKVAPLAGMSCCKRCTNRFVFYDYRPPVLGGMYRYRRIKSIYKEGLMKGFDMTQEVRILSKHAFAFTGCHSNYSCLCGHSDLPGTKRNPNFPLEFKPGGRSLASSFFLFTLLLLATVLFTSVT